MINHKTNEVFFDNLEVPAENLIGEEGQGFRYILDGMNAERILVSGESLGDAPLVHRARRRLRQGAHRVRRPIGQNQGVQFPIARAYAELEGGRPDDAQGRRAVRRRHAVRRGGQHRQAAGLEAAWHAAEACMQTFGGFGSRASTTSSASGASRASQIAPISTNLILAYLGQHVVRGPPTS